MSVSFYSLPFCVRKLLGSCASDLGPPLSPQPQLTGLLSQKMFFCLFTYVFKNRATFQRVSVNHFCHPAAAGVTDFFPSGLGFWFQSVRPYQRHSESNLGLMPCLRSSGSKDKSLQTSCTKCMRNGVCRARQSLFLDDAHLPLTLFQASLGNPLGMSH